MGGLARALRPSAKLSEGETSKPRPEGQQKLVRGSEGAGRREEETRCNGEILDRWNEMSKGQKKHGTFGKQNSCAWAFTWGLSASLLLGTPGWAEEAEGAVRLALTWQREWRSSWFGETLPASVTSTWFHLLVTLRMVQNSIEEAFLPSLLAPPLSLQRPHVVLELLVSSADEECQRQEWQVTHLW